MVQDYGASCGMGVKASGVKEKASIFKEHFSLADLTMCSTKESVACKHSYTKVTGSIHVKMSLTHEFNLLYCSKSFDMIYACKHLFFTVLLVVHILCSYSSYFKCTTEREHTSK